MKTTKLMIVVLTWIGLCVSAAYLEYRLLLSLGMAFGAFAILSGLAVLLGGLGAAPIGYEDEHGFHIKSASRRTRRARRIFAFGAHSAA